jgi:hypothetical protein
MAEQSPNTIDLTKPQLITKEVIESLKIDGKTDYSIVIVPKKTMLEKANDKINGIISINPFSKKTNNNVNTQVSANKNSGYNSEEQEYDGKKLEYLGKCISIEIIRTGSELVKDDSHRSDTNDVQESVSDTVKFEIRLIFEYVVYGYGTVNPKKKYDIEINKDDYNKLPFTSGQLKFDTYYLSLFKSINYKVITKEEIMESPKPLPKQLPIPKKPKGGKRRTKKASKRSTKKLVQKRVRRTRR